MGLGAWFFWLYNDSWSSSVGEVWFRWWSEASGSLYTATESDRAGSLGEGG